MTFDTFHPHPLVRGGPLQTLAGQLLAGVPVSGPRRVETVRLRDGDRLLLDIDEPALAPPDHRQSASRPLVLLMHGLGGCSESTYVVRIGAKLNRLGYTVVRFNHRGCGRGGAALARQIYHAGRVDDLEDTLRHVEGAWPDRPFVACAFSLSGNMLLRLLGEPATRTAHPALARAMAVCPPVDLDLCSRALAKRANWAIDRYYTRRLVATARARARLYPDDAPLRLPRRLSLRIFDEIYTAPRAGFPSRAAYYDASSARRVTDAIATPTLLLAAADDPIIPPATFAAARFSPAVNLRVEASGGHMGFIARRPTAFGDRRWLDAAVVAWVTGQVPAPS